MRVVQTMMSYSSRTSNNKMGRWYDVHILHQAASIYASRVYILCVKKSQRTNVGRGGVYT